MLKDFTFPVYRDLIQTLRNSDYLFLTFKDYLSCPTDSKCVILRHDIDAAPAKALEFARYENSFGVESSYYFKTRNYLFNKEIIKEIVSLGHEIGYHYEDLAKAKGDPEKAIRSFKKNLELIRTYYPVTTICMDGSVLSGWNNLDLWKYYDHHSNGITGEPYLDLDFNKILYLSDTGRRWNAVRYSLYDKVDTMFSYVNKSTFDIIHDLKKGDLPAQIMITTHPQRWHSRLDAWMVEVVTQWVKNRIKFLIIKYKNRDAKNRDA
jgi:hypothetical protein